MPTLLLSDRPHRDNQLLWRAAIHLGWRVERIRGWRPPETVVEPPLVPYVEGLLMDYLKQEYGFEGGEPPSDWLCRLPWEYRRRAIRLTTLDQELPLVEPVFLKPPNDKSFPARVYGPGSEPPPDVPRGIDVLAAEPVAWEAEYRCFVLESQVVALSPYLRQGELAESSDFFAPPQEIDAARAFAESLLADARVQTPAAVVLDVGSIQGRGWAAVELNAPWGSGIYGCDPTAVLNVLLRSAQEASSSS